MHDEGDGFAGVPSVVLVPAVWDPVHLEDVAIGGSHVVDLDGVSIFSNKTRLQKIFFSK